MLVSEAAELLKNALCRLTFIPELILDESTIKLNCSPTFEDPTMFVYCGVAELIEEVKKTFGSALISNTLELDA